MDLAEHINQERDACWQRYRQFIVGLNGLQGEVLAAHLAVEAELDRSARRLLANPDVILEKSSFSTKVKLLQAVWPGPRLQGKYFAFIALLNSTRNAIAHEANQERFETAFQKLGLCARQEMGIGEWDNETISSLRTATLETCGFLSGLTHFPNGEPARLGFILPSKASRDAPAGP